MTYELKVEVANGQATATFNCDNGPDQEKDADRGKAALDYDPLMLATVQLLQKWLGRWQMVSEIGSANKTFPVPGTFQVLGEHLYKIVFADDVGTGFIKSYDQAQKVGQPLRVMLSFAEDESELAALPWEFLYLNRKGGRPFYLATETQLVLNRVLPGSRRAMPVAAPPLRVLFIMSVPKRVPKTDDPEQLENMRHRQEILGSIHALREGHPRLEVTIVEEWNIDRVEAELKSDPHVVHIIGHARPSQDSKGRRGEIELPDIDGILQWNNPETVVALLTHGKSAEQHPRLVILHLCETKPIDFEASFERLAPDLIKAGIPAVLAMQYPMSASAFRRFTATFYERLAAGDEIDQIVQSTRYTIYSRLNDNRLIGTPVLYMQSLDGRLVREEAEVPSAGKLDPHQVSTRAIIDGGQGTRRRLIAAAWSKATDEHLVRELEQWIEDSRWFADVARNEQQIRQHMKLDEYVSERGSMYLAMLETLKAGTGDLGT
jgi:hypothetical protein